MELVHDVLDKQLYDKSHKLSGRIDGIVLELRDGDAPRVAFVETSGAVLARRLHPRLAGWAAAIRRWWAGGGGAKPTRIPWSSLRREGVAWRVDADSRDTPAFDWELWLRENVVARLPGGRR